MIHFPTIQKKHRLIETDGPHPNVVQMLAISGGRHASKHPPPPLPENVSGWPWMPSIKSISAYAFSRSLQFYLARSASRSVVNCTLPKSSIYAVLSVDLCRNLQRLNLRESKRLATGYRQLFAHHQPRAWPRFALLAQPPQIVFEIGCCRMVDSDSASASARVNCIRGVPKKSSPSPFN
jgi:hypothetical protein